MSTSLTRIFSDLHFGDRASTLDSLERLRPLCEGADAIVLNGDTIDTRPGDDPALNLRLREGVARFCREVSVPVTLLTGNHDPDLAPNHHLELPGDVLVMHGDALFDDLVPWSQDAPLARRLVAMELARIPVHDRGSLAGRMQACRKAAAAIPQRHQSERHGLKYLVGVARETFWPPSRVFRILRAWRETPRKADAFLDAHRPAVRLLVMGHTHRAGAFRSPAGRLLLNTGSFCPPGRSAVVDITDHRANLRHLVRHGREYRFGATLAEFPLAAKRGPARS